MGKRWTYAEVKDYINNKFDGIELIDSDEDFENKKIIQNKTALYVKLEYRCKCGETYERSFDVQKTSPHGFCKTGVPISS